MTEREKVINNQLEQQGESSTRSRINKEFYEFLGVSESASYEEIKNAFGEKIENRKEENKEEEKTIISPSLSLEKIIDEQNKALISFQQSTELIKKSGEKDLEKELVKSKNVLFHMKPEERELVKKDFSGLDAVLYEKLLEKVGTKQMSTKGLIASQSYISIVNAIPILGNATQLITTNVDSSIIDNLKIKLEKSFDVAEVKEIVKKFTSESEKSAWEVHNMLIKVKNEVEEKESV